MFGKKCRRQRSWGKERQAARTACPPRPLTRSTRMRRIRCGSQTCTHLLGTTATRQSRAFLEASERRPTPGGLGGLTLGMLGRSRSPRHASWRQKGRDSDLSRTPLATRLGEGRWCSSSSSETASGLGSDVGSGERLSLVLTRAGRSTQSLRVTPAKDDVRRQDSNLSLGWDDRLREAV